MAERCSWVNRHRACLPFPPLRPRAPTRGIVERGLICALHLAGRVAGSGAVAFPRLTAGRRLAGLRGLRFPRPRLARRGATPGLPSVPSSARAGAGRACARPDVGLLVARECLLRRKANRPNRPGPAGRSHPDRSGRMDSNSCPPTEFGSHHLATYPPGATSGDSPGSAEPPAQTVGGLRGLACESALVRMRYDAAAAFLAFL